MTYRNGLLSFGAVLSLVLTACGSQREAFEPAEQAAARSPQGYSAAHYNLETSDEKLGEARVWSQDARPMRNFTTTTRPSMTRFTMTRSIRPAAS